MKLKLTFNARFLDHLIQAILIFASVFLAFWLTELRDSKNKLEKMEVSLQQIAEEMRFNHNRLEWIYDYYSGLNKQLDSIAKNDEDKLYMMFGYQINNWMGLQMPMLRSTGYTTFLNSGINEKVDVKLMKDLADIYNVQSTIERLDNSIYEMITVDHGFTELSKIRHLSSLYLDLIPGLIMVYQKTGKDWLAEYGYDLEIKGDSLLKQVEESYPSYIEQSN